MPLGSILAAWDGILCSLAVWPFTDKTMLHQVTTITTFPWSHWPPQGNLTTNLPYFVSNAFKLKVSDQWQDYVTRVMRPQTSARFFGINKPCIKYNIANILCLCTLAWTRIDEVTNFLIDLYDEHNNIMCNSIYVDHNNVTKTHMWDMNAIFTRLAPHNEAFTLFQGTAPMITVYIVIHSLFSNFGAPIVILEDVILALIVSTPNINIVVEHCYSYEIDPMATSRFRLIEHLLSFPVTHSTDAAQWYYDIPGICNRHPQALHIVLGGSECLDSSRAQSSSTRQNEGIHGSRGNTFWLLHNGILRMHEILKWFQIATCCEFVMPAHPADCFEMTACVGIPRFVSGTENGGASRQRNFRTNPCTNLIHSSYTDRPDKTIFYQTGSRTWHPFAHLPNKWEIASNRFIPCITNPGPPSCIRSYYPMLIQKDTDDLRVHEKRTLACFTEFRVESDLGGTYFYAGPIRICLWLGFHGTRLMRCFQNISDHDKDYGYVKVDSKDTAENLTRCTTLFEEKFHCFGQIDPDTLKSPTADSQHSQFLSSECGVSALCLHCCEALTQLGRTWNYSNAFDVLSELCKASINMRITKQANNYLLSKVEHHTCKPNCYIRKPNLGANEHVVGHPQQPAQ